jgi:hypothetical protein
MEISNEMTFIICRKLADNIEILCNSKDKGFKNNRKKRDISILVTREILFFC